MPVTLLALATTVALAGPPPKVEVCHASGGGSRLIEVSSKALSAHLGHGDSLPSAWYPDADGDGFGNGGFAPAPCPQTGLVENADDCDDADASSYPGAAELDDGRDNDCDGDIDEDFVCPCFDGADLDDMTDGQLVDVLSWTVRANGRRDVFSVQAYSWLLDTDGIWKAPAEAADVWTEGGAAYCSTWSGTYLAAPYHAWDTDLVEHAVELSSTQEAVCRDELEGWVEDAGLPITSW